MLEVRWVEFYGSTIFEIVNTHRTAERNVRYRYPGSEHSLTEAGFSPGVAAAEAMAAATEAVAATVANVTEK